MQLAAVRTDEGGERGLAATTGTLEGDTAHTSHMWHASRRADRMYEYLAARPAALGSVDGDRA